MIKKIILLLALLVVCGTQDAHAIRIKKTADCVIVHESAGQTAIHNFLEDVLFLLPTDLSEILAKNFDQLYGSAKFVLPNNYWQHNVLAEPELKQIFYSAAQEYKKSNSDALLTRTLGKTVEEIVEIAMLSSGFDPLKEQLRNNVSDFLTNSHNKTYLISQDPYKNHSFDAQIDKLYSLRKFKKDELYPELVKVTANLWTSVWLATGHTDTIVPQLFYRRPFQLVANMKPWRDVADRDGRVSQVRDQREMMIVLRNLDSDPSSIEGRIVNKRLQDNVRDLRIQQEAESEYKKYRKKKGIKDEVMIIDTDDLSAAIKRQRVAGGNADDVLVVDYQEVTREKEKCDSLERCLLN